MTGSNTPTGHNCLGTLQVQSAAAQEKTVALLEQIANTQRETHAVALENNKMLRGIMETQAANNTVAPESNLQQVRGNCSALLPARNINRGDLTFIGQNPVSGSTSVEVWEGLYLGQEKVAIKIIRTLSCSPKSLQRFKREVKVWGAIWEADSGKHVLPLYGFCLSDEPSPYMVSAWPPNGTAITYVKKNPDINHKQLIRGIAEGIAVLHSMTPPVVHGDIKGSSIVIGAEGNPLITDFDMSRIVEDVTGVPFSQSKGEDSYRWFAPELCFGEGTLSTSSDVYAFAMTILELLTHEHPYSHIKRETEVLLKSTSGKRPRQPTEPSIIERGLDDDLWNFMMDCWGDMTTRPSIKDVLVRLQ